RSRRSAGCRAPGRSFAHATAESENEPMATLLADLVAASGRAAETASRIAKRGAIAEVLRSAARDEGELAVAWLAGETRRGRVGVGWAPLAALRGAPATQPELT